MMSLTGFSVAPRFGMTDAGGVADEIRFTRQVNEIITLFARGSDTPLRRFVVTAVEENFIQLAEVSADGKSLLPARHNISRGTRNAVRLADLGMDSQIVGEAQLMFQNRKGDGAAHLKIFDLPQSIRLRSERWPLQ